MVIIKVGDRIKSFAKHKDFVEFETLHRDGLDGVYYTMSSREVYTYSVSGTDYQQRKQSAYSQCKELLKLLNTCYYDTGTLFDIVGWVQRNAGQYGLHKRLSKEGYNE